jgi:hypothetical protein
MLDPYEMVMQGLRPRPRVPAPAGQAQPEAPPLPPIGPAQEDSLLARAGQKALSGLGYLGSVMDKSFGGRAVRGLLGGKPREAMSLLPFSDTLGLTDEADVVHGRDLLENAGLVGKNEEGLDLGDVAGFATEMALDPSMYLSFGTGALTKAGLLTKQAGALPGRLSQAIRGFHYLEPELEALRPVAQGVSEARLAVPAGSTIAPRALVERAAREGVDLLPQFRRTEQAAVNPVAQALKPTAVGPGVLGAAPTAVGPLPEYADAARELAQGHLVPQGKYGLTNPEGYQMLDVGKPTSAFGASATPVEATAAQFADQATKQATPLAGLVGIGLPFSHPSLVLGTGESAARFAEYAGAANDFLKGLAPARYARALLDPTARGVNTREIQDLAGAVARPAEKEVMAQTIGKGVDLRRQLEPLVTRAGKPEVDRLMLRAGEGVPVPGDVASYLADLKARDPVLYDQLDKAGELQNLAGHYDAVRQLGRQAGAAHRDFLGAERGLGINTPELDDELQYVMRQRQALPVEGGGTLLDRALGRKHQAFPTGHSSQMAREEIFKNLPEGTAQVNDLVRLRDAQGSPVLTGPGRTLNDLQAEALLRKELTKQAGVPGSGTNSVRGFLDDAEAQISARQGAISPEEAEALRAAAKGKQDALNRQAQSLAAYFKGLDPRYATEGHDYFTSDPLSNLVVRGAKSARAQSSAKTVYEALRRYAQPLASQPEAVPVADFLRQAGLAGEDELGRNLGEIAARRELGTADLSGLGLRPDIAKDLSGMMQPWRAPEEVAPLIRGYDSAMNLWKGYLTAPFPAFHTRNVASGLFNILRQHVNPLELYNAGADARNVLQGRAAVEALPGMRPGAGGQEVLDEILKEASAREIAFLGSAHRTGDTIGGAADDLRRMAETIPGRVSQPVQEVLDRLAAGAVPMRGAGPGAASVGDLAAQMGLDTPNWLGQLRGKLGPDLSQVGIPAEMIPDLRARGTGQAVQDWLGGFRGKSFNPLDPENVVLSQARQVGNTAEDWLRMTNYIALRRQGYNPAAAADLVHQYQILYRDVTPFERNVMKRLVPFYTFGSRNLKNIVGDLATAPAHLSAATRLSTGLNDPETFIPPYLREGAAIAIPGGPDGSQRYVSSLGLPIEDEWVKALGSALALDPQRTAGNLTSGLNPLLKYPMEVATGTQLSSGRKLEDLYPSWLAQHNPLSMYDEDWAGPISQAIAQSPASRASSTLDKVVDPRKGPLDLLVNLGSGVKATDVDAQKQKEIVARDLLQQVMKGKGGAKTMEKLYVPADKVAGLSEEELLYWSLYKQLERDAQKKSAQKKKAR